MAKYIFYTDEGYTISPNNSELESFQILGFEDATTVQEGINKLIENNTWISESEFNIEKIKHKTLVSSEDIDNLKSIIDYLWKDEEKHFEETDEEERNTHIFQKLKAIKSIL
jgi:hypothetical protein